MKVKATVYKDILIIETLRPGKDEDFIPAGGSKIGCVLMNTGEHLGLSEEAFTFIKNLKTSPDDIGDVDTFKTTKGVNVFGWLGPICILVGPEATLSNEGFVDIDHIKIPNESNKDAIAAIDGGMKIR